MTRIAIVDDHPVVGTGLRELLLDYPDIEVVAEGSDGTEAIDVARKRGVDVIPMDVAMPLQDGVGPWRRSVPVAGHRS